MTTEIGAYFFDSSLLQDKSEFYLTEAQNLVDNLLKSDKYQKKKQEILSRTQPIELAHPPISMDQHKTNPNPISNLNEPMNVVALPSNPNYQFNSSQILSSISAYKDNSLRKLNPKYKRERTKTQNTEYLNVTRAIYKKVNSGMSESLGKRGEMIKETIDEINSKRFENQEKWLERYLELKEEIMGHRVRIIALKKALKK
jgi:hypothetical protein